jgi:hypothetical protein
MKVISSVSTKLFENTITVGFWNPRTEIMKTQVFSFVSYLTMLKLNSKCKPGVLEHFLIPVLRRRRKDD